MRVEGGTGVSVGSYELPGPARPLPAAQPAPDAATQPVLAEAVAQPVEADGGDASFTRPGGPDAFAARAAWESGQADTPTPQDLERFERLVQQVHSDLCGLGALGEPAGAQSAHASDEHVDILV